MGVIEQAGGYAKTLRARAVYVARTEGIAAMLRQAAEFAGLLPVRSIDWTGLRRGVDALTASCDAWPAAVLVVSSGGARGSQLAALDCPVLRCPPDDPGLSAFQQLVSTVFVIGRSNLSADIEREAQRLGQRLVLQIEPGDEVTAALPACDVLLLATAMALPDGFVAAVVPDDGTALGDVLLGGQR